MRFPELADFADRWVLKSIERGHGPHLSYPSREAARANRVVGVERIVRVRPTSKKWIDADTGMVCWVWRVGEMWMWSISCSRDGQPDAGDAGGTVPSDLVTVLSLIQDELCLIASMHGPSPRQRRKS